MFCTLLRSILVDLEHSMQHLSEEISVREVCNLAWNGGWEVVTESNTLNIDVPQQELCVDILHNPTLVRQKAIHIGDLWLQHSYYGCNLIWSHFLSVYYHNPILASKSSWNLQIMEVGYLLTISKSLMVLLRLCWNNPFPLLPLSFRLVEFPQEKLHNNKNLITKEGMQQPCNHSKFRAWSWPFFIVILWPWYLIGIIFYGVLIHN